MIKTELYFGMSIGTDTEGIDYSEFNMFVENHITPCFPDGFTVVSAEGRWRDKKSGYTVHENCQIVVIVHNDDDMNRTSLANIRSIYCNLFNQDSVMKIDSIVSVSF